MQYKEFDNVEDMFAFMRQNEEVANSRLAQAQRDLGWGDHFVVFQPADMLVIFGYCMTREECAAGEAEAMRRMGDDPDNPECQAELEQADLTIADAHERGYLFGWHWSLVEPTGELGSTHSANAWPISKRLWEAARDAKWSPKELPEAALVELDAAYQGFRKHTLSVIGK